MSQCHHGPIYQQKASHWKARYAEKQMARPSNTADSPTTQAQYDNMRSFCERDFGPCPDDDEPLDLYLNHIIEPVL